MDLELVHRAHVHAALGDPHRLAVVDALHLSDRSPSELAALLGVGSNLMAHHLGVLADLGIIVRVASEGDRRKRFVQLVPSGLSGLQLGNPVQAQRIVFVCTENSARSQLAEAMWNRGNTVPATSAGIAPAARLHPGTLRVATRLGLDLTNSYPKPLPELSRDDLVISVCDRAHAALTGQRDICAFHWSIPDPAASNAANTFDQVAAALANRISTLGPNIISM